MLSLIMKHIYFVNERIRLRAMEPEDLELLKDHGDTSEKYNTLQV